MIDQKAMEMKMRMDKKDKEMVVKLLKKQP